MKFLKYALFTLLFVSVCKKAIPSSTSSLKADLQSQAAAAATNVKSKAAAIASEAQPYLDAAQAKVDAAQAAAKPHLDAAVAQVTAVSDQAQTSVKKNYSDLRANWKSLYAALLNAFPGLKLPSKIKLPSLTMPSVLKSTAPAAAAEPMMNILPVKESNATLPEVKKYDAQRHTATVNNQQYICVKEYKQAVTPPNIAIPALERFGTVENPNYKAGMPRLIGGQFAKIVLYGIPVQGKKVHIFDGDKKRIGSYWPESQMAQLFDGTTIVMIKQQAQSEGHDMHATGPAYTWYSDDELANLKNYGVSANNLRNLVNPAGIGTATVSGTTYTLYGVSLSSPYQSPLSSGGLAAKLVVSSPRETTQSAKQTMTNVF